LGEAVSIQRARSPGGGFDIDEFDAHANARLYDTDDPKAFYALTLAGESDASSGFQRERLPVQIKHPPRERSEVHAAGLRSCFQID